MDLSPVRGCRDFLSGEAVKRGEALAALKRVFESYGFNPLETPALESLEVLLSKYAGGSEILKEVYKLEDQGGRSLGLRYDLTVPLCRVIAGNPRLALPFKRYQTQSVWRDGPIKAGRYREFTQCDVDIVGIEGVRADAELAALAFDAFQALGLEVEMRANNRKLLNALLARQGVPDEKRNGAILALDKLEKLGAEGVLAELVGERALAAGIAKKLLIEFKELDALDNKAFLKRAKGLDGASELAEFLELAEAMGAPAGFVRLQASLARGLAYYTGTVFEVFLKNGAIKSSLAAGGRFDGLVGAFSGKPLPAVGLSFGLDVICEALPASEKKSVASILVAPVSDGEREFNAALAYARALRALGVNALTDLKGRSPSKNAEWASKQGVAFVAFVGSEEASGKARVKDLASGEEAELSAQEAAGRVKQRF
ncbi:MAG: histidine--tRNA ligase [Candidatus Micrarchaeia archaeon]